MIHVKEAERHTVILEERKRVVAEGVRQVDAFTDKEIRADTVLGYLVLKGEGLSITDLNLDTGRLVVEGRFEALSYAAEKGTVRRGAGRGLLERLFR
ncbi:YabP/YqfC family sporulation protein [Thermodesulfitimonas sp.]